MTRQEEVLGELLTALEECDWLKVPLTPADVVEVVRGNFRRLEPQGFEIVGIAVLKDGRFMAFEGGASCDTGWTCQAGLDVTFHATAEDAWVNGLGTDNRAFIERGERVS